MSDKPNDERSRIRNLKRALREADRLAEELDIPRGVRTDATSLYRRIRQEGRLPGRGVEEVVAASLYLACRDHEVARSPDEFAAHSDYDRTTILRAAAFVDEVMSLNIPPASPKIYFPKIADELELSNETVEMARELIDSAENTEALSGVSPTGAAAGAIYAASNLTGENRTQSEVAGAANVTEVTIRNRYQDLLEEYNSANEEKNG